MRSFQEFGVNLESVLFGFLNTYHKGIFRELSNFVNRLIYPVVVVCGQELIDEASHCTLSIDVVSILSEEFMVFFQILPSQILRKTLYFIYKPLSKSKIPCKPRIDLDIIQEALDLAI
jgi:hypothetical protein